MKKTYFYIVILGETDKDNYQKEEKRLKSLGEVIELTERTYGLTIKCEDSPNKSEIRKHISGPENNICIVIRVTAKTNCSWCLYKTKSEFLTQTYQILYQELENDK